MMVLKRALLLTLLILTTTRGEFQWTSLENFIETLSFNIDLHNVSMSLDCQGKNVSYSGSHKHSYKFNVLTIGITSCSPSNIMKYVNDAFDKPTIVQWFEWHVTSKSLPSAELQSLDVGHLILTLDADTTIPINNTYWSSLLTQLTIRGGHILQLSEDTEVNMTRLPEESFSGLKSLIKLYIQDNKNIEIIGADVFKGLNELQKLALTHNRLKYIEAGALDDTPDLRSLDLSYNLLESLPNDLFQSLEQIVEIILQGNQLKIIDSEAFAQLPSLKFIDISNCTITVLPENVFTASGNIDILKISHNNIRSLPSNIFRHQRTLKELYLSYNRLRNARHYNVFHNLKMLEILDLSNNGIQILSKSLFLDLNDLREIDLSNNKIKSITKELVRDPNDIELMYDKMDKLSSKEMPFKLFTKLRTLNLAGNEITDLDFDTNEDLQSLLDLEYLDLSRNQITIIPYLTSIKFAKSHSVIDLSYNNITSLYYSDYITPSINQTEANSYVILTGNPIECDCRSYGLHLLLNGANPPDEPNYIFDDHCASPPHLTGQRLIDVSPELLICNTTLNWECPGSCSSCYVVKNERVIDCQKLPSEKQLLDLESFAEKIILINVNTNTQPTSLDDRHIYKLNLSNAGIQSLTFTPNDHLKILDVSHNNLTTIPNVFFKDNFTIYLSNNPLKCECQFVQSIFALNERGLLPDFNETTCVNEGKVAQININEFCGRSVRLVSIIGWSTIGSFVAIVTVIKLYLNANKIWLSFLKTFCKRRYEKTWTEMKKLGIEETKQYDLFISFAHQDTEFVTETLLPKLENEFSQKVCIHTRDWIVGNVIANQIIESVENSRRTVVILSEHFLMSEWAELEFYTAHTWGVQEGKSRIIIILLKEEVARDERMSNELKSYLVTNTYLLWGDPIFWEKLQKVLPAKIPKYVW